MSTASAREAAVPPTWAVQRVAALVPQHGAGVDRRHLQHIARRTGLNKGLVRLCLIHLKKDKDVRSPEKQRPVSA